MNFKIKLVDKNPLVSEQLEIQFSEFANIEVFHGNFEDVDVFDCLVSPANSFGHMDGGIDEAITQFFGKSLEDNVQSYILKKYFGEQPVGTSFIIPTQHPKHPFLAHTPTMRMPQNIQGTLNVYYAMKAMLISVYQFNEQNHRKIKTVLCPGMGTLVGEMLPYNAVSQMVLAYKHFLNPPNDITVPFIYKRVSEIEATRQNDNDFI